VSARNIRAEAAGSRAAPGRERARDAAGTTRRRSPGSPRPPGRARGGRPPATPGPAAEHAAPAVDRVVVGTVPAAARVAGGLLVLAGLVGAVAPFLPYLVVGGRRLAEVSGPGTALVALLAPVAALVLGGVLALGRLPKLGMAYAAVAAALSAGPLLIEVYEGSGSTSRPATEFVVGVRVLTSTVTPQPGWVLGLVALGLTVLAGVTAASAWGRTVMEDGGSLDAARSSLAGAAVLLGVLTVLCLALPPAEIPDEVVTDPSTGVQSVVTQEGPRALLERPGLALLGGLLLAGAVVLCAVVSPSLRPRLAAVGGLLALAVAVLGTALGGLRDALLSRDLVWTLPGIGLLLSGLGFAALAVLAWRLRRGLVPTPLRRDGT
jgi:hypothetical protein